MGNVGKPVLIVVTLLVVAGVVFMTSANRRATNRNGASDAGQTLRVAMSGQYPPFNYYNEDNDLVGFDVDIARELAKRLGKTPEFTTTAWDGILAGLLADKFDVIIGSMAITEDRKKAVNFSDPYYISGAQLFVRAASKVDSPAQLKGKVVGVTLGSTYEQYLREKVPGIRVQTYKGPPTMVMELTNKRIDGFVTDRLVGLNAIKQAGRDFALGGDLLYREQMGIPVRKENTKLLAAINEALAAMRADGAYANISVKWFGRDITVDEEGQ